MMNELFTYVQSRLASEKGQGIVEYALILAFVVILAIALSSSGGLGDAVKATFQNVIAKL